MTRSILCTLLIIIISCGNALARQTAATGNPKETAAPAAAIAPAAAGTISTEEEAPATGNAPAAEAPASEAAVPADGQKQLQALKAAEVQSPIRGKKQFLPTRRRIDREINKLKFAYKGEVIMGLTASYGTMSSDDTDIMLILDGIDADGTVATVKPSTAPTRDSTRRAVSDCSPSSNSRCRPERRNSPTSPTPPATT